MKNEQLLLRVYKLKMSLNEKKRKEVKVRCAIKLMREKIASLVRENTLHVKEYAALEENHTAQVAGVSGDRDAALAALRRLRGEVPLNESQLFAVRKELETAIYRTEVAEIRCKAEQAVASKNPNFCCRTSYDLMRDPVSDENGMTHERDDIEQWFAKKAKEKNPLSCPYGKPLVSTKLIPNLMVKNMISEAVDKEVARLEAVDKEVARLSKPTRRHPLG